MPGAAGKLALDNAARAQQRAGNLAACKPL